jgi:hypothetical protein
MASCCNSKEAITEAVSDVEVAKEASVMASLNLDWFESQVDLKLDLVP